MSTEKRVTQGVADCIELAQAKGYPPREMLSICLSLAATIGMNYLGIDVQTAQRAVEEFGDKLGVGFDYKGPCLNPNIPEAEGLN